MNKWELTKNWISHLKGMQIAELNPDPATKKVKYRRQPTVEDLYNFLTRRTDFEKEDVINAIKMMLSKSSGQPALPTPQQSQSQSRSGPTLATQRQQPPRLSQNTSSRPPPAQRVNEDFIDDPGRNITEKDVELVFDMLISSAGQAAAGQNQQSGNNNSAQQGQQAGNNSGGQPPDKAENLKKIKQFIRTQLAPEDIMGLWRNLKNG